jgi:predicted component of type VI protein secretion system
MFPEAPIKATVETPKVTKGDDESFLSRHGGKVAAVAIGISVGLIYSYILSGRSRNEVEDKLVAEAAIEPYEVGASRPLKVNVFFLKAQLLQVNELRFKNNLNQEVYDKLTVEALRRFPNGMLHHFKY